MRIGTEDQWMELSPPSIEGSYAAYTFSASYLSGRCRFFGETEWAILQFNEEFRESYRAFKNHERQAIEIDLSAGVGFEIVRTNTGGLTFRFSIRDWKAGPEFLLQGSVEVLGEWSNATLRDLRKVLFPGQ